MYTFKIFSKVDLEDAWETLALEGCELLYSSEDLDGSKQIFGFLPPEISIEELLSKHPCITSITSSEIESIDWDSQWAHHGHNYKDGFVHVNMHDYVKRGKILKDELRLQPGPGFGDLSHPTTLMVLEMMGDVGMQGKHVLDVGCGSGILSLAACAMGAKTIHGIDIDEEALVHARQNAVLNGMENIIHFDSARQSQIEALLSERGSPSKKGKDEEDQSGKAAASQNGNFQLEAGINESFTVLMNMIQLEQQEAWQSLSFLQTFVSEVITSGILVEGKQEYLEQCHLWGWQLLEEREKDGWLGFVFKTSGLDK